MTLPPDERADEVPDLRGQPGGGRVRRVRGFQSLSALLGRVRSRRPVFCRRCVLPPVFAVSARFRVELLEDRRADLARPYGVDDSIATLFLARNAQQHEHIER